MNTLILDDIEIIIYKLFSEGFSIKEIAKKLKHLTECAVDYPNSVVDEIKKCLAVGEPVLEIAPWVISLIKVIGPIVWDLVKDYALPKLKQWCLNKYGSKTKEGKPIKNEQY